jgi:hypothetical protein
VSRALCICGALAAAIVAAGLPLRLHAADSESLEETLGGFGDDDDLGGFDDEEGDTAAEAEAGNAAGTEATAPAAARLFDLTGDLSLGSSYSYLRHSSATGTPYGNLNRLRAQLDLQLDVDLPGDWKARIEGYGFYDFSYVAKGRSRYTDHVLEDYEWEIDLREAYVQGSPVSSVDVKLGRQIVNWGRSDTLRVLDVLNPLDNREPGLVDIEDLRLPVTMARVDYFPRWIPSGVGDWSLQLLVIPEFRQDRNPSIGNDFNPTPFEVDVPSDKPDRFGSDPEYGGSLTGTFSGWDVSFYAARVYENQPLVVSPLAGLLQRFPLVTMVGAGGNWTTGSWLFKAELGWFDGLEYNLVDLPEARVVDKSRLDAMAGVEYYGWNDVQIALEVVNRHIFDFDPAMKTTVAGVQVAYAKEDLLETALRVTADFLNQRLRVTGVALLLGTHADVGSVVRAEASYDLMDALVLGGGIVLYQQGTSPFFQEIGRNDRLFLRLEYSF